ncbi:MAG: hypothetical protein KatS3mg105_4479 [Gemmatales bacterium]|nr:MAG: hypothetical protein KatS3mg105_4479 [Gemmatales bacterium]
MRFANELGIRVMLAEFSPIPKTPDGEACRGLVDLDEPLWHNKTVFPYVLLGADRVRRLKELQHDLNRSIESAAPQPTRLAAPGQGAFTS